MPIIPRGNGLSAPTNKALKDLERDEQGEVKPPPAEGQSWAVGTAPTAAQTMRHPGTGAPMTPAEAEALLQALRRRQVPPAK